MKIEARGREADPGQAAAPAKPAPEAAGDAAAPGPRRRSFSAGKRWLEKLNLALVLFLSLYILVVGNLIVYRHPYRIDLTSEGLHTLSDATKKRLELVDDDILVIIPYLFREDQRIFRQIFERGRMLLDQYIALQPRIRIEAELNLQSQEDSLRWVEYRDRFHLTRNQLNTFIFVNGSDETLRQVVPVSEMASYELDPPKIYEIHAEEAFTKAITRLIERERKTIYFTTDWKEPALDDEGQSGLSRLREELEGNGFRVEKISLLTAEAVPPDCDLLVIFSPATPFRERERTKVQDYLLQGGRLLVTLGPLPTGIEKLLAEWSVRARRGQAFQKQRFVGGVTEWSRMVICREPNASHPITRGFAGVRFEVLGSHVRPLEVDFKDDLVADVILEAAAPGKEELFADDNLNQRPDEGELRDSVGWGVAVYRRRPDRPPPRYHHLPTRIVVYGDGSPWTNFWFDRFSHRDLAVNTVRWLLGQERDIGAPGQKWETRVIKWSPDIASFLFWVPIFLFPGIVLSFGAFVYFLRRS